jgi:hypothetical protein
MKSKNSTLKIFNNILNITINLKKTILTRSRLIKFLVNTDFYFSILSKVLKILYKSFN